MFSKSKEAQLERMMGLDKTAFAKWKSNVEIGLKQDDVQYIGEVSYL